MRNTLDFLSAGMPCSGAQSSCFVPYPLHALRSCCCVHHVITLGCTACTTLLQERWLAFIQQKVSEWQKGLRFEPKQGA